MRKMSYASFACEISVAADYRLISLVPCEYEKDTVAYAVERFFTQSKRFCRECTQESWKLRIAKGRKDKKHSFVYIIPAVLMELPGTGSDSAEILILPGSMSGKLKYLTNIPVFPGRRQIK